MRKLIFLSKSAEVPLFHFTDKFCIFIINVRKNKHLFISAKIFVSILPNLTTHPWARIFKRSLKIDSNESIPSTYVAWRAGTTTLFLLGS